ncbi:MAG: hypothetical protein SFU98_00315 [Leptospiraceae bacterium]|nr:hypothetical protein [Leptospiraceae bacterium]
MKTGYIDARPDIESGILKSFSLNKSKKIILLGSSYSASLALLVGTNTQYSKMISSILAFSPGEYLKGISLLTELKNLSIPIFLTSSKKESSDLVTLCDSIPKKYKTIFKPVTEGFHGSRVLHHKTPDCKNYWEAVKQFLDTFHHSNY